MKPSAVSTLSVCLLCAWSAMASRQTLGKPSRAHLPLLCAFNTTQHEPRFQAVFKNDTANTLDLPSIYPRSSVILDGKSYSYAAQATTFLGASDLKPGRAWTYTVNLSDYIPGWKRLDYDKDQQEWRWQSGLATGTHTLTLSLGGVQFGPVDFAWDADRAFTSQARERGPRQKPKLPMLTSLRSSP